jgi:hypothetical protein
VRATLCNSPNTNTAEREAMKGLYRLTIGPASAALLASLPGAGPIMTGVRFAAGTYVNSNEAASDFADTTAGEREAR